MLFDYSLVRCTCARAVHHSKVMRAGGSGGGTCTTAKTNIYVYIYDVSEKQYKEFYKVIKTQIAT